MSAVPANNANPFLVHSHSGRYYEKLSVDRPQVHLLGESWDGTVITYDDSRDTPDPDGGTHGTRVSFTLRITAPGFRAENLTIENGFDGKYLLIPNAIFGILIS